MKSTLYVAWCCGYVKEAKMEQRVFVGGTRCAYVILTEKPHDTHGAYWRE